MITQTTATDIALAYREIDAAQKLLADLDAQMASFTPKDIRDQFGRPVRGLELGVPTSDSARRCFNVPWALCRPILEGYIADRQQLLNVLCAKAQIELQGEGNA